MSETRRVRRGAARQQAHRRALKVLAERRKKLEEGHGLLRWSSFLLRRRTLYVIGAFALVVLIGAPVLAPGATTPAEAPTAEAPTPVSTPTKTFPEPAMQLSPEKRYSMVLQTTKGVIRADLFAEEAPVAVNNFVYLAQRNFYNGLLVYEVDPGQRIEAGALQEDGTGGPGYTLAPEPSPFPVEVGALATVAQGEGVIGAPFLIALADLPDLGPGYVAFGRITDGLDVARQLKAGDRIITLQIRDTEVQ